MAIPDTRVSSLVRLAACKLGCDGSTGPSRTAIQSRGSPNVSAHSSLRPGISSILVMLAFDTTLLHIDYFVEEFAGQFQVRGRKVIIIITVFYKELVGLSIDIREAQGNPINYVNGYIQYFLLVAPTTYCIHDKGQKNGSYYIWLVLMNCLTRYSV